MKTSFYLPCVSFFSSGRFFSGLLALLMQISIVFWPMASAWARETDERSGVERMLAEFSEAHRPPPRDPYAAPAKRFREAA